MITIPYPTGLVQATFSRKARRFTAEVILQNAICEAHIPSSGRMAELLLTGAECLLVPITSSTRKTKYTLVAIKSGQTWVSVDSMLPNKLMRLGLYTKTVPELSDYSFLQAEYTVGHSRFDFLLGRDITRALVEVKSVTYVHEGCAKFPDAPTARGRKHLDELRELRKHGFTPIVAFVVQRSDAEWFTPYNEIDPAFAIALLQAQRCGVRILAYKCEITPQGVTLIGTIPVRLET